MMNHSHPEAPMMNQGHTEAPMMNESHRTITRDEFDSYFTRHIASINK